MSCKRATLVETLLEAGEFENLDAELGTHIQGCEDCSTSVDAHILEGLREADVPTLSEQRAQEMRFRLVHAARRRQPEPAKRRGTWLIASSLSFSVAVGAYAIAWSVVTEQHVALDKQVAPLTLAHVDASADGDWTQENAAPHERVRMESGSAWFQVDHLRHDESFIVVVGSAEVEVRGTRFRVQAHAGELREVRVDEGRVEVRIAGETVAILEAPAEWTAPPERPSPPAVEEHLPNLVPARAEATRQTSTPRRQVEANAAVPLGPETSADETRFSARADFDEAFSDAWQTLQRGDANAAAARFESLSSSAEIDDRRRADVLYWAARLHAEAGRDTQARSFLERLRLLAPINAGRAERLREILNARE